MNKTKASAINNADINQKAWAYLKEVNSHSEEQINATALVDGCRSYTYAEMFGRCEKNAAVFSALGITYKNNARAGLIGSTSSEAVFALYGLNMVGAEVSVIATFSSFRVCKIIQTVQEEKLTDLILTDDFVQPDTFAELVRRKNELGLRNIVYLHIPIGGKAVDRFLALGQEQKYASLWNWIAPLTMDYLLAQYDGYPVDYGPSESCETAFILHTSGTTTGTGKPIPLSDKALNFFGRCYRLIPNIGDLTENAVCGLSIDLSSAYGLVNQLHAPLALNAAVALVPGAAFNPLYFKTVPEFKMSALFCVSAQLEMWMQMVPQPRFDFSALRGVIIGGSYISSNDKRRYYEFLTRNGAKDLIIINGYGLSELGGACILSTGDPDDESIGYPLPGVKVCLCDEETGDFLTKDDAPCTGVLYLRSDAMTCGCLDGREIVKREMVGEEAFLCSNDLVSMDETGKITYLGRANRYFLNNSGIRFESGKVETAFSAREGINSCTVVPVYIKTTHDNIPMLCVEPLVNDETAETTVCNAFRKIFVEEQSLEPANIPLMVMIAEKLPRNANGKIDTVRITKGGVSGKRYTVERITDGEKIKDFRLAQAEDDHEDMIQQAVNNIIDDIFAGYQNPGCLYNNKNEEREMNTMFNFNEAQNFFNNMNQMGTQWMGMMNWTNQMNQFAQMNQQMNQMMASYSNQMYQLAQQVTETVHKQNMEMLEKINDMMQSNFSAAAAPEKTDEE